MASVFSGTMASGGCYRGAEKAMPSARMLMHAAQA